MSIVPSSKSSSLQLAGSAYVALGEPAGLAGKTSCTLETWVKLSDTSVDQTILSVCGADLGFSLVANNGGVPGAQIACSAGMYIEGQPGVYLGLVLFPVPGDITLAGGDWNYMALTYDSEAGLLTLYYNGLQVSQYGVTLAATIPAQSYTALVGSPQPLADYFDVVTLQGEVGRAAVWSAVRDAEEVLADGSISGIQDPVADASLEVYLDFSILPVVDYSGDNISLSYVNGATLAVARPALELDGAGWVTLGAASQLDFAGDTAFTIDGWFYATAGGPLVSRADAAGTQYGVEVVAGSGVASLEFTRGAACVSSNAFSLATWYHFAAVFDPSVSCIYLYINGNLQASLIVDTDAASVDSAALIGASAASGTIADTFVGLIQNIRLWNVAQSQDLIRQWMFNQPTTDTTLDCGADFTVTPPADTTGQVVFTLEGDAATVLQGSTIDPASSQALIGDISAVNASYLNQSDEAANPAPAPSDAAIAATPTTPATGSTPVTPFHEAFRIASWQAIAASPEKAGGRGVAVLHRSGARAGARVELLSSAMSPAVGRSNLRHRFDSGFAEAQRRLTADPGLAMVFSRVVENGILRVTYHGPTSEMLVYEGSAAIDPCTLWWIQFIFALTIGFLQAIGLAPTFGNAGTNVSNRIYNLVTANLTVVEQIEVAVAAGAITVGSGISLINTLYQQKLLWPVLKIALTQLGYWALAWVLVQCIKIITGAEAAAALAGFIVWSIQLTTLATTYSTSCPINTTAEATPA